MSIRFNCPGCGKRLKALEEHRGARVRCTGCGQVLVVPEATRPAPTNGPRQEPLEEHVDEPVKFARRGGEEDEIDMTPMIDMTFLLLIFFMVTASFSLQKSINMPAPDAEQSSAQSRTIEEIEEDDDFVIVQIEKDNTVWVDGSVAPSRHEVIAKLRDAHESKGASSLLVTASEDSLHETVVMVLDAGTAVGMENVRLSTGEPDEL